MAKLLRISDKLLLGLSIATDIFSEVKTAGGIAGTSYNMVYGYTPARYKKTNYYSIVSRMFTADMIEKLVVDGEVRFRITSKGKEKLHRDFPLVNLQNRAWDKKWRVLVFDIPEDEKKLRDLLRAKLKELSFGLMQRSVWISPHAFEDDMREFLDASGLTGYAYLFVSTKELTGDVFSLVQNVWKVDELNESYKQLVGKYNKGKNREFASEYLDLIVNDPFLPRELLPESWWGNNARKIFTKLTLQKDTRSR